MNTKRGGLILVLLFIFLMSFVLSATNSTNQSSTPTPTTTTVSFEKSYNCLTNLVNSKISNDMTAEELSFSLLALGYNSTMQSKIFSKLEDLSKNNQCWPESGCTIKDSALALLAYEHLGKDTSKIESWLGNQTQAPSELVWYLQIDSDSKEKAECSITVDNSSERKVTLNEDKTITGSAGSCFSSAYNGIWLEISPSCYGKEIEVSCDKDFLTNLIYKKKSSQTVYVPAFISTQAVGGKTTEVVESACFKQGSSCTYEGSLWAALALQKTGNDIKKFLPYLLTLSEDNQKYNPSAFLFILTTGFDEYYTQLINSQYKDGYWQLSDTSKRYYDTALSILALGSNEAAQKAKDYLLQPKVQGEGCYNNNIRDTAFVVYAASPKNAAIASSASKSCTSSNYFCVTGAQCEEVNGTKFMDYSCLGAANICCSKKYTEKSCSERSGVICLSTQTCSGDWASGLTGCCLNGNCQEPQEEDGCTTRGYTCKVNSCGAGEQEESYQCPEQGICCSIATPEPSGSKWWLWLLIILIILLVLAIIFRNQLKIWWFKVTSKFSKGPVQQQIRPGFPPTPPMPSQQFPRRIIPQQNRPLQKPFPKDKELDETLRKLKDMSK